MPKSPIPANNSKTSSREAFKTTLIVIIAILVVVLCLYIAVKLISIADNGVDVSADAGNIVLRAVDGDTLELGSGEIIRLMCVDTPEVGESGYEEAKSFLYSWIDKDIRIEKTAERDKYNRTLAWVYSSDVLINKEIVDAGFGSVFEYGGEDCERVK